MRRIFLLCLIALLAETLPAQKPERPSGKQSPNTTQRSTPADTNKSAADRSSKATESRTRKESGAAPSDKTGSGSTTRRMTQPRQVQPATLDARSSTQSALTPLYSNPSNTNPRSAQAQPKNVKPLKPAEQVRVNWMTLEEALEKSKTQRKKVFIDVYTDWCGWCKRMDDSTFSDPAVAKYLNDNFYAVKLNAEQQQDITYKGKVYHFKKNGARGYHELASTLLNNRLIFPTTVFLDENQDLIQALPNYVDARKMEAIINYFGTDNHKKTPWETYEKNFESQQ